MNEQPSTDPSDPNEPRPLPLPEEGVDEDALSAWVLGALDTEEDERVADLVARDRDLAERAAQMEEVVAVLGSSVSVVPSPAMRERVLAALGDVQQVAALPRAQAPDGAAATVRTLPALEAPRSAPAPAAVGDLDAARARREARPTRRSALRGFAVAAAGVVVGAAGVGAWLTSRTDPLSFAAVRDRVEAAPDVRSVAASDATGAWAATELRYSERLGQAVVVAPKALPSPSGGVYQLWRQADPGAAPTPLDPFSGDDGVVVAGGVAGAAALAVSRERGPGATAPTDPVLVHYFLDA